MTFWELSCAVAGWNKAHGADGGKTKRLNAADADRLADYVDQPPMWH